MSIRKTLATLVDLTAGVIMVWSIHGVVTSVSCALDNIVACGAPDTGYLVAIPVAMAATALARLFLHNGVTLIGMFLGVAAGSWWAAADLPADMRNFPLLFGGLFTLLVLFQILRLPFTLRRKRQTERLLAEGKPAIATVTSVSDTGVTINHNPRVRLTYRVDPADGSPSFTVEKTKTVSRVAIPHQGACYRVRYDPDNRRDFVFDPNAADTPAETNLLFTQTTGDPVTITTTADALPPDLGRLIAQAAADSGSTLPPEVSQRLRQAAAGNPTASWSTVGPTTSTDPIDQLARLHELHRAGAITESEFEAQKYRILNGG